MTSITLGSNTYNLIPLPSVPGFQSIELGMTDEVAVVPSPYVPSQVQTQQWPGADGWDATLTVPPLTDAQSADWEGFLAELRGPLNVFQVGDPRRTAPLGSGAGTPVCSGGPAVNSTTLLSGGWAASAVNVLLRGDMIQVGYRLYRVCEGVSANSSGLATITVWPVLRDSPASGTAIVLANPVGVFRLSGARRAVQASKTRLSTFSVRATEVR